ncbi:MAG: hypothetical protein K1X55_14065 [Chitinophagales bacterium]|nr:hypothetical protein [Chitinophagales bacterium]
MLISLLVFLKIPGVKEIAWLVIVLSMILAVLLYLGFFRTLGTYLYAKFILKMELSLAQARQLDGAFAPINFKNMSWLPMKELRNIEHDKRFEVAIEIYQKYSQKQQIENNIPKTTKTKILRLLMYSLMIYFAIAGFMNLPPANFLTNIFCSIFKTEKYYPVVNVLILCVATEKVFKLLDKKIK